MASSRISETGTFVADLLPRAGTRWCEYEKKALEIRKIAGIGLSDRLDPEHLALLLNYKIVRLTSIDELSDTTRIKISAQWSGAALSIDHYGSDFAGLIIINDLQSHRRQRATLMEEICHLLLGHRPSRLDQTGRSYDRQTEEEAYAVGAASLLPFKPLAELYQADSNLSAIAERFDVSLALVRYRLRVLRLTHYPKTSI